jgi:hypothetical protein
MQKNRPVMLFVEGVKLGEYRIVDQDKNPVTIEEARRVWEGGEIEDYNISLFRLATQANWDFIELDRQYAELNVIRHSVLGPEK